MPLRLRDHEIDALARDRMTISDCDPNAVEAEPGRLDGHRYASTELVVRTLRAALDSRRSTRGSSVAVAPCTNAGAFAVTINGWWKCGVTARTFEEMEIMCGEVADELDRELGRRRMMREVIV